MKRSQAHDKKRPRVTASMVSRWARGVSMPDLENALAVAAVCGHSVPLSSLVVRR